MCFILISSNFENIPTSITTSCIEKTNDKIINLTCEEKRKLFVDKMKKDNILALSMRIKWIFFKCINPRFTIKTPNYNIQGYYNALIDMAKQDDYYKQGALWINEAFEKLYYKCHIPDNLDKKLIATYKLLYLFVGESRYYNIAFALARSVYSRTSHLCSAPFHIKQLSFYKSCIKLLKTGLLDSINLGDLNTELNLIFETWKQLPTKVSLRFGHFNKPKEQYLIESTAFIFRDLKCKGLYSNNSEELSKNLNSYIQMFLHIFLLQSYLRTLQLNEIISVNHPYLSTLSTTEPKDKLVSGFTILLTELYNQTQDFLVSAKPNKKEYRLPDND